jgi:hypothetical protein
VPETAPAPDHLLLGVGHEFRRGEVFVGRMTAGAVRAPASPNAVHRDNNSGCVSMRVHAY